MTFKLFIDTESGPEKIFVHRSSDNRLENNDMIINSRRRLKPCDIKIATAISILINFQLKMFESK